MRLIDAYALKQSVCDNYDKCEYCPMFFIPDSTPFACEFVNLVDKTPTVDAVPVVHGDWRRAKYGDKFECSNCLHVFDADVRYKYCPHCGTKMRW